MKIGVLTSSRADYGIYSPLLKKIKTDSFFSLEIIAFGTHLSSKHGYTLKSIEADNYAIIHKINSLIDTDDRKSIVNSYGLTIIKFADFWQANHYDIVFCLGDRFEMSAAVQAGIPFGVKFAHIHGGETTKGAIDNIYRHQITLASEFHFTATNFYKKRVIDLLGSSKNVFSVGSLSLDSLKSFVPTDRKLFLSAFEIPAMPFALVTFHPETRSFNDHTILSLEMKNALSVISKEIFLIITMPNADTEASLYREAIVKLKTEYPKRIVLVENFGKQNYFSAMTHSKIVIGNSSSGIIEAASFGKYVVNVGNRQEGRVQSKNIINCKFDKEAIIMATNKAIRLKNYKGSNIYYFKNVADNIINTVKKFYE